ncbi:hypothetical protein HFO98_01410 [Rhizobium leguminosarum]|uniref:hypothetical protein n=1 Tax=Rhizobium leguminosarum TaxID=384 RepID=UPI001C98DA4B|nr:hypothetical protein [Rhizobium leguminosarum]MBY5407146.1 hypothetical protein [Rhizobium leguminosarum]
MRRFQQIRDWSPGYINVCPQHIEIMVECTACGVMRAFDRTALPNGLRHALVETIEQRLKCACGAKTAKLRFGHSLDGEEE